MLMSVRRHKEALPILEPIVEVLEEEVEVGVRHPETLMRLAQDVEAQGLGSHGAA